MLDYHRLYPLMPVIIKDLSHLQKPQHQWIGAEPEMRARETDYAKTHEFYDIIRNQILIVVVQPY